MDVDDETIEKYRQECLEKLKDKDFTFKKIEDKEKNHLNTIILSLLRDYRVENKLAAMKLIKSIISTNSFEDIQDIYLTSIYDEILKSFSFRDCELIALSLDYCLLYIQHIEGKEKLMDVIVYELNYNDKLNIIRIYVSNLLKFCEIYGTDLIASMPKFLMTILQLLEIKEEYILKESLNVLEKTMNLIWPILVKFYDMILGSMFYVYIENSDHEGKSAIHQQIKSILILLEKLTHIPIKERIENLKDYEVLKPIIE